MFSGKAIIGIAGGIGSGKSYVARLLGEMGCRVIDSDAQVRAAYNNSQVRQTLRDWWGDEVFTAAGEIDKRAIAAKIFCDPHERSRLERLLHPMVNAARIAEMAAGAENENPAAFVWDTPLLFEAGLNASCDFVIFVESTLEDRRTRVEAGRHWDGQELARRENLQWPLDKKREMSDYVVKNTADADDVRCQVSDVLSQILTRVAGPRG